MPYSKTESDGEPQQDGRPFGGKLDDVIAKAIPQRWLATAFAGAVGAALIFLILMIFGFARGGTAVGEAAQKIIADEKAKAAVDVAKYKDVADKAREAQDAAKKELGENVSKLRVAERKAGSADSDIASAAARQKRAEDALAKLKEEYQSLDERLKKETVGKRDAEGSLRTAERDRDSAARERDTIRDQMKKTADSLTELRKKYDELSKQKADDSKRVEVAKAAFESIIGKATAEPDLEKRLELLKQLRDESLTALAGTAYAQSIGDEIVRVDQQIQRFKKADVRKAADASKEAARKAAEASQDAIRKAADAYKEAMRKVDMTKDHASAMEILTAAKEEVAGTAYENKLHGEIERREKAEKERVARETYDNAMKKLRETPDAHEENLQALKAAIEQVAGTAYAAKLQGLADAKEKSLTDDIARAAYTVLNEQVGKAPADYDANIAAAEEALAKAKGSRYEAKVQSILGTQQARRLDAIGRDAYDKSLAQVKGSKDRAANVAELEAQKAKAAGSTWEAKIDGLLVREKKLLEREKARSK